MLRGRKIEGGTRESRKKELNLELGKSGSASRRGAKARKGLNLESRKSGKALSRRAMAQKGIEFGTQEIRKNLTQGRRRKPKLKKAGIELSEFLSFGFRLS
jgi:hypothetical protein